MTSARLNCPEDAARMWGHGKVIPRCQIQSHTSTLPLPLYQLQLQLEREWIYLNTQSCTTLLVLQSVQWWWSEAASNEIHFRSKVRTAKAATCPKILCCAPCAHREQLPQLRPWQYCDLVHTSHKTLQDAVYYVWQLELLHNLGLVQGWVLSAARSKGGLTKPRTPSSLPSIHTKVFQSSQSVL